MAVEQSLWCVGGAYLSAPHLCEEAAFSFLSFRCIIHGIFSFDFAILTDNCAPPHPESGLELQVGIPSQLACGKANCSFLPHPDTQAF